jgi:hypothetical protein
MVGKSIERVADVLGELRVGVHETECTRDPQKVKIEITLIHVSIGHPSGRYALMKVQYLTGTHVATDPKEVFLLNAVKVLGTNSRKHTTCH